MAALYDTDFTAWTREQAGFARTNSLNNLDLANIAEELDCMGRSEHRQFSHNLYRLMGYLMRWCYQPEHRCSAWRIAILESRIMIERILEDSPSILAEWDETVAAEWSRSVKCASTDTGIPRRAFPKDSPWDRPELLDTDFLPDCDE